MTGVDRAVGMLVVRTVVFALADRLVGAGSLVVIGGSNVGFQMADQHDGEPRACFERLDNYVLGVFGCMCIHWWLELG